MECTNCGSEMLTWDCAPINHSPVVDGRLRGHDMSVTFWLGCDECSATVAHVTGDQVINYLNLGTYRAPSGVVTPDAIKGAGG